MADHKLSPWLRGIIDTLAGAHLIRSSQIPTKNRLVVILVDTAFETACRSFLKHKAMITLDKNHSHRDVLVKTVRAKLSDIDEEVWKNIDYYYTELRCDFYHQSAGKTLTDTDLLDYQETVEFVIDRAFGIQTQQLVRAEWERLEANKVPPDAKDGEFVVPIHQFPAKKDKILIAVASLNPGTVEEVNDWLKRAGDSLRLKKDDFTSIVARNSGTKKFFFYNRETRRWELSGLGKFRLQQLSKGDRDE